MNSPDIWKVTRALMELIQCAAKESPEFDWSDGYELKVIPDPPERIKEKALGLYLYHIGEDLTHKNSLEAKSHKAPIEQVPLTLNLYYQLSAHSGATDTLLEQRMLGFAVKALNDHPVITEDTEIGGKRILDFAQIESIRGPIRLTLESISRGEAARYWMASTSGLRLAVFFRVSVNLG